MHYYQFNIKDYRKDTSHLTLLEHAIYRSLIDTYYLSESPLPADNAKLMRMHSVRTKDEKNAFFAVLEDFFILGENGYHHERCDGELSKIYEKSEKARASAKSRWDKKKANAMRTHSEGNANGMLPINPLPNNPLTNNKNTLSEQSSDVIDSDKAIVIDEPKQKEKPKPKPKPKFLQWDMDFAKYMHQSILEIAPLTKNPNFDDWANTIRLIRESDGINYDVIQSVFEWANKDSFWKTNIKSPSKLRAKFADLHSKMLNPPKTYVTAAQRMADVSERIEKMDSIEDFEF